MNRSYPRDVWVLQPSFRLKQVTVVRKYSCWGSTDHGDETEGRKRYAVSEMFATREEAITAGREQLKRQQADLTKKQENLKKRLDLLDAQSGES